MEDGVSFMLSGTKWLSWTIRGKTVGGMWKGLVTEERVKGAENRIKGKTRNHRGFHADKTQSFARLCPVGTNTMRWIDEPEFPRLKTQSRESRPRGEQIDGG